MIRSQLFKGRAAAVVAAVVSVGLIAGVVGEAYGYLLWGGTPVSTDITADQLLPNESSDVYIVHDTGDFTAGTLGIVYTVEPDTLPPDLWQQALYNPTMSAWCNSNPLKFVIKRNNKDDFPHSFWIVITPVSEGVLYSKKSDKVWIP